MMSMISYIRVSKREILAETADKRMGDKGQCTGGTQELKAFRSCWVGCPTPNVCISCLIESVC